jgi:hypothetical protein
MIPNRTARKTVGLVGVVTVCDSLLWIRVNFYIVRNALTVMCINQIVPIVVEGNHL